MPCSQLGHTTKHLRMLVPVPVLHLLSLVVRNSNSAMKSTAWTQKESRGFLPGPQNQGLGEWRVNNPRAPQCQVHLRGIQTSEGLGHPPPPCVGPTSTSSAKGTHGQKQGIELGIMVYSRELQAPWHLSPALDARRLWAKRLNSALVQSIASSQFCAGQGLSLPETRLPHHSHSNLFSL